MPDQVTVFKRKAWRKKGDSWIPNPGATRRRVGMYTRQEAIDMCTAHNSTRPERGVGHFNFTFMEWTAHYD